MICNKCGKETKGGIRFCGHCGNDCSVSSAISEETNSNTAQDIDDIPLNSQVNANETYIAREIKPSKKDRKGIILTVALSLVVLSLGLLGGFYIASDKFADNPNSSPSVDSQNTTPDTITDNSNTSYELYNDSNAVIPFDAPPENVEAVVSYIDEIPETDLPFEDTSEINLMTEIEDITPNTELTTSPLTQNADYILPESSTKYLNSNEIIHLSLEELRIARNEIYARHGRLFTSEDLQRYFYGKSWYNGTIPPDRFQESILNSYEKKNLELIVKMEDLLSD